MSQSNSNTGSKKSNSEQLTTILLHISTGACIIADVLISSNSVITTRCPMELDVVFDEDGDVRDFVMRPYLHPFGISKADSPVNFNTMQICSISEPHPLIRAYYYKSLNQIDGVPDDEPDDGEVDPDETESSAPSVTLH